MRKKRSIVSLILAQSIVLMLCGCGNANAADFKISNADVVDFTEKKIVKTPEDYSSEEVSFSEQIENEVPSADMNIEVFSDDKMTVTDESNDASSDSDYVDLTILSSTVVYAEVYNMMYYPENYIGKTVKMHGLYDDYFDESTGKRYHACIIMDATACCAQGIEFVLTDDYEYPADYPKEADDITVEGIFDVYTEESGDYCTLRNARLL